MNCKWDTVAAQSARREQGWRENGHHTVSTVSVGGKERRARRSSKSRERGGKFGTATSMKGNDLHPDGLERHGP